MTIWIDVLFFGPFYVAALYAYAAGKAWIRIPSIIYASTIMTNVLIILSEEAHGTHATPNFPVVLLANLPWLLVPLYIIYRIPQPCISLRHATRATAPGRHPAYGARDPRSLCRRSRKGKLSIDKCNTPAV